MRVILSALLLALFSAGAIVWLPSCTQKDSKTAADLSGLAAELACAIGNIEAPNSEIMNLCAVAAADVPKVVAVLTKARAANVAARSRIRCPGTVPDGGFTNEDR